MIKEGQSYRQIDWMMLRYDRDPGTESNIPGARKDIGNKQIIGRDRFPGHGVVLPNPGLCETQSVGTDHHFDIFIEALSPRLFPADAKAS